MCFFVGHQTPTSSSLAETRGIAPMIRYFHWSIPVRHVKNSIWLVVEPTPLKNHGVKVSWDDDIPNIWKNKKCLKPPTSHD